MGNRRANRGGVSVKLRCDESEMPWEQGRCKNNAILVFLCINSSRKIHWRRHFCHLLLFLLKVFDPKRVALNVQIKEHFIRPHWKYSPLAAPISAASKPVLTVRPYHPLFLEHLLSLLQKQPVLSSGKMHLLLA